jgi:hypothetical protein
MLDYTKLILEKVSFDSGLFEKELRKARLHLDTEEYATLKKWCIQKFGDQHQSMIHLRPQTEIRRTKTAVCA